MIQAQIIKRSPGQRAWLAFLKYWAIFQVSLRNSVAYVAEALSRLVFLGLILFILAQLWEAVYSTNGGQKLAGFSLNEILWYLTLTEVFTTTRPAFHFD